MKRYMMVCEHGDYKALRAPNTKRCPTCGGILKRSEMLADAISTILCLQPIRQQCADIGQPLTEQQIDIMVRGLMNVVLIAKQEAQTKAA